MNNYKRARRRVIQLLALFLIAVTACSISGDSGEFKGVVVAKRDSDQILVVPGVDAGVVQGKTPEELLAIAREKDGVYFSVDKHTFETVTLGTSVVVYFDPDDGEEVSDPPRRHSQRVEILDDYG